MKKLLLLPALFLCSTAFAQKPVDCNAVKTENAALKEKVVAYEARLGIGVGGVTVADGDDKIKVKFLSCVASKSTHKAVFAFLVVNSDEPTELRIYDQSQTFNHTTIFDEQGQSYPCYSPNVGGSSGNVGVIPTGTPVKCTLPFEEVPASVTRLNTVMLSLKKKIPGMSKETEFKTAMKNMPVTWVP